MIFWVRIRLYATGGTVLYETSEARNRGLFIIATTAYADVVEQGEREAL